MEAPGMKFTAALNSYTGDFEVRPETARLVAEGEDGYQVVAEGKTALRAYHDGLTRANSEGYPRRQAGGSARRPSVALLEESPRPNPVTLILGRLVLPLLLVPGTSHWPLRNNL